MSPAARLVILVVSITLSVAVARAESPPSFDTISGQPLIGDSIEAGKRTASVREGEPAPNFDIATSYGWRRFRDVCRSGEIVLVFGASERTLASLQDEVAAFSARGVTVLAVRGSSDGENWETLQRLGLTYALLADPDGHVGRLFGAASAVDRESGGAWFLVDRRGRVQATGLEPSGGSFTAILSRIERDRPVLEAGESR